MTIPIQQATATAPGAAQPAAARPAQGNALSGPELTQADFARIAQIAYQAAGLAIGAGKSAMVRTRLARRLRALGLPSFSAYCAYLDGEGGEHEIGLLVSALTTNVSNFYRENHHFEILRKNVLDPLVAQARAGRRVRVWSAGCANGQEPYTIAMTMMEAGMPFDRDVKVLATDIDPNVVRHGNAGVYPETMLSGLPDQSRDRYFEQVHDPKETQWRVKPQLKSAVQFRVLNLLDTWPMRGRFDAIFCRNVVIYFDAETQDRLWNRFARQLTPDGWLFIGHSERLSSSVQPQFKGRGVTAYQHVDPGNGAGRKAGSPTKEV